MTTENLSNISVIFDMDGVLVDTVKLNWQAMNEALAPHGIHISDENIRRYLGRSLQDQVKQLGSDFNVPLDYAAIEQTTTQIKQGLMANLAPKEGTLELLNVLKLQGVPLAVATSNSRRVTEQRLTTAGIRDFFDVLVTEDDVTEHKPDPAVYAKTAELLGTASADCIVFEDAPAGVASAKAAGMKCIAVETPYVPQDDLLMADRTVSTLAEVNPSIIMEVMAQHRSPEKAY